MYGIPNMKLDKKIVERRVNILEQEGISFVTNTEVGKNYPVAKLINEFDAVVLCCGATKARDLVAEGREGTGNIYFAVDFLKRNTKSLLDSKLEDRQYVSAEGKDVIIVGGGDTGTDCVGTAIRHGCKSVVQFEIMPEAPLERTAGNPWPQWPRIRKTDYGQQEAIKLYGKDPREYLTTVKKVEKDEKGNIKAVHTVKVEWQSVNGRMTPKDVEGSEKVWPCQLMLIAMGFTGPEDTLIKQLSLETDARSNVKANEDSYRTSLKGVFAAGDMRRGQSLVVWAIHEGREAAKAVDRYLNKN
jgi:glutamate synthase (NADPH/NADH) small chain